MTLEIEWEPELTEQQWLQQLITYVHEFHKDKFDNWEDFLRNYGTMDVWKDAYDDQLSPADAWEDEMSYFGGVYE